MSTIKVDTIQKNGGASEISIDKLGGVTAAASISVIAEGGTNTTTLQQGLAKSWAHAPGSAASLNDSFNVASLTDTGTGNCAFNFTTNMAASNYALSSGHQITTLSGTGVFFGNAIGGSSNHYQVQHYQNAAAADPQQYSGQVIHGDLA